MLHLRRVARLCRAAISAPICDEPVPVYAFGAGHTARCWLYDDRSKDQRPAAAASTVAAVTATVVAPPPETL